MRFENLGQRIAVLRKEKGFTQEKLSEMIGISRPVMVKIENNQRTISLDEGELISSSLSISIDTLLDYEKEDSGKQSFIRAFKTKGICELQEKEIRKFELLFDALCTQEAINLGEQ